MKTVDKINVGDVNYVLHQGKQRALRKQTRAVLRLKLRLYLNLRDSGFYILILIQNAAKNRVMMGWERTDIIYIIKKRPCIQKANLDRSEVPASDLIQFHNFRDLAFHTDTLGDI